MSEHTPSTSSVQAPYYVYVIEQDGGEYVKIGVTDTPKDRLRNLQHGSPLRLEISLLIRCQDEYAARQLESFFHLALNYCAAYGEWFHINAALVHDLWNALRMTAPVVMGAELEGESVIRSAQRPMKIARKFKAKSRYVLEFLRENPEVSTLEQVEIAMLVTNATGVPISQSTVSRALASFSVNNQEGTTR